VNRPIRSSAPRRTGRIERLSRKAIKWIAGLIVIVAFVVAVRLLPVGPLFRHFQAWVHGLGAWGYVVYTLVYAVAGLFFPASVLTIGAGALFGVVGGSIVVVLGATITATVAFLLARTVLRSRVEKLAAKNPKFQAIDEAIAREGAKIVVLVRLSALFPFLFVNYSFGLTGIRTVPYVLATFFGIMPLTVVFVYFGAAGVALGTASTAKSVILAIGAVFALAVSMLVARIAGRAVKRATS
jgi:uncharacterized membrane protein YdjX (TVP38/TMEM64 family)